MPCIMLAAPAHLAVETAEFYRAAMRALQAAGAPFLVGGAYAFARYTSIERHTKDFDIFCRPADAPALLGVLAGMGCRTERTFPHWLGKAYAPDKDDFVDVIYSSGSGIALVDDLWFAHAVEAEVLGVPARLCPAEEMIWSKAFIMERERFDGADIIHILRARAAQLDWDRLLARFGPHWRVLLSHLILFGFVYPGERGVIPKRILEGLLQRLQAELVAPPTGDKLCRGTLISREQYLEDIRNWGYRDARLDSGIHMTPADIAQWTDAIPAETTNHGEHDDER